MPPTIEDSRTKHPVLHECRIACHGYGVDAQSMFVIQLSVKHDDLRKVSIAADESTVRNTFKHWLGGMKTEVDGIKYVPKFINPVVYATGTVYENDEIVRYGEQITVGESTERTDLERKLQTKISWFEAEKITVNVKQSVPAKSQLTVTLFNSAKEMERSGMILTRNYPLRISHVKPRISTEFRFHVQNFERGSNTEFVEPTATLFHKMTVGSALLEKVQGYENLCNQLIVQYRYNSSGLEHECKMLHNTVLDSSVTLRLRLNRDGFALPNPIDYVVKWNE
ncbi:unnamed protein product [Echinostoma caproni]|uniref:Glyco_hydro_38C domain-containing protein n=1 Tax=Echinostoma caproni TaxID=27848 RepID=A0A183ACR5_9TREM|nr:unnamed protein product [Echinostoma caproni]